MNATVRVYGHLGELLQGRVGSDGSLALITLPSPDLYLELQPAPAPEHFLPTEFITAALQHCGRTEAEPFRLRTAMPIGAGAGASTAALLAIYRAFSPKQTFEDFSALALALEGASDPLHLPAPERVLWASREGRVLAHLPPLPGLRIVGGFEGPGERTDPLDLNFPDIADLIAAWPAACQSAAQIGALVTRCSQRSMALRGKYGFERLYAIAERHGALGVSIAHTGSARGFLMLPEVDPTPLLQELTAVNFTYVHSFLIGEHHA
ncbi:propanediol utilization protein [Falsigemmobacter faecalis]|uniref:Propanediol utilization protein n=1 Tax=Falsigemmobacter faecalis TaxID=2488730 RepID=A0A3P3DCM6_9RHOB|nr:propanediol utilization protein [Falsigemmobacter faecalis]RRH72050.1 propanediol utilization protein [Falsigemmobacter faecalis]